MNIFRARGEMNTFMTSEDWKYFVDWTWDMHEDAAKRCHEASSYMKDKIYRRNMKLPIGYRERINTLDEKCEFHAFMANEKLIDEEVSNASN